MCQNPPMILSIRNHDRDVAGLTYVYPVVSRRAGGVSVGVNLNPNNACNWRCVYCQVPDLVRGGPPPLDLTRLEAELRGLLGDIVHGDFLDREVPEGMRHLHDVALSGNGEPTTAAEFPEAVRLIGRVLEDLGIAGRIKLVLITNGSQLHKARVQEGIRTMAALNGEVWFKFDRGTRSGLRQVNDTQTDPQRHLDRLRQGAKLCPTWIQSCFFQVDGTPPSDSEMDGYLAMLKLCRQRIPEVAGVLLYGISRPSRQPEAPRLSPVASAWLAALASRIEALGFQVRVAP